MSARSDRFSDARRWIGYRCWWRGDDMYVGEIVDVVAVRGGWPAYRIAWPDDAPAWWGREISTTSSTLEIEPFAACEPDVQLPPDFVAKLRAPYEATCAPDEVNEPDNG